MLVLIVLVVVQLLDANTIVPVVMNRVLGAAALAVVLALVVGWALAGLIGSLLAVPVAAAIQVLVGRVLVPYVHHIQGRPGSRLRGRLRPCRPGRPRRSGPGRMSRVAPAADRHLAGLRVAGVRAAAASPPAVPARPGRPRSGDVPRPVCGAGPPPGGGARERP